MNLRNYRGAGPEEAAQLHPSELRSRFLVEGLFAAGALNLAYTHFDRMIVGAACPAKVPLSLGDGKAVGTAHFLDARELGIANLGGEGAIEVDGKSFRLANRDVLYVGRGARSVTFMSIDPARPARFYLNSVPAGASHPVRLIRKNEAKGVELGEASRANRRRLAMYIHPEVSPSCLLLMGITDLAPGSVWNTMPPHVHERRMEAYCYFDLAEADRVVHLMGRPECTRHLMVANGDVVLSPSWSIHMGCGTGPYAFVWGMTGENQAYNDFDPVGVAELR
jgi:4-deoxy-L-threo-5-hexosulose-uronate ketol-isomerase